MNLLGATTALIVIDVQESFRHRPYFGRDDVPAFLAAQNALIAGFAERGLPIVRVLHVEDEGAFALASGWVRPLDGLIDFVPTLTVQKRAHSAFAGTELSQWLIARGIRRLVISGIRTEQCCETTTRDASDRGFEVGYVTAATLTFPMRHANGRDYSCAEIKERTELVLDGRFAQVLSVERALARADAHLTGALHAKAA
jgi:nicotinamidase-related amidase